MRKFSVLALLIATCVQQAIALGQIEPPEQTITLPARPTGIYEFLARPYMIEEEPGIREKLPFKSIELKQRGQPNLLNFTPGTVYKIAFARDGTAIYEGTSGLKKIGVYRTEISLRDFGMLCLLLERFGVQEENCDLGVQLLRSHPIIADLKVHLAGKEDTREYRNDSSLGDFRFWVIQSAIERVAQDLEWKAK